MQDEFLAFTSEVYTCVEGIGEEYFPSLRPLKHSFLNAFLNNYITCISVWSAKSHHSLFYLKFFTSKAKGEIFISYHDWTSSRWRHSDLSFTNSLATSSLVRCDKILRTVKPVSSRCTRRPKATQQAQEPCSMMSRSCIRAIPMRRSSLAKQ